MTSILLSSVNQFGHFSRIAIQNESKKMINFTIQQYSKMFPILGRNLNMALENENSSKPDTNISNEFTDAFNNLCQRKQIQKKDIASIIDHITSPYVINTYQIFVLLNWCNKVMDCLPSDKVELCESLWCTLNACNFSLNTHHYQEFLKLYLQNEWDFSPIKLLLDTNYNKIYPDDMTYHMYVTCYCIKGDVSKALVILKNMQRMQIPILKSVFNLLLTGYSKSGDITAIRAILKSMKLKNIQVTAEGYVAIMCAYAKLNNIHKVQEVIKICNLKNIHFTNDYILKVIYMIAANCNDCGKTYASLINIMCQNLTKKSDLSNNEIQLLLKLVALNKRDILITIFPYIGFKDNTSKFKNIIKLISKQAINKSMVIDQVVKLCTVFNFEKTCKMSMLYYALMKSNHTSLILLRECKHDCTIRPHYFWPLLIRQGYQYDLLGILDIIKIMITDFNVQPCIDTIADYVLPFTFGNLSYTRNLLMKYGINESVIDNAYVLLKLKRFLIKEAAIYIRHFPSNYFYKVIAHDLRYTSICKNDVQNFVYISCNLIENTNLDVTFNLSNKSFKATHVPMDKQLWDLTIDFPTHTVWFKKVLHQLQLNGINLEYQTSENK